MFEYDTGIASGGVLQTSEPDSAIPPAEQLANMRISKRKSHQPT
jgi:hypothetical protein